MTPFSVGFTIRNSFPCKYFFLNSDCNLKLLNQEKEHRVRFCNNNLLPKQEAKVLISISAREKREFIIIVQTTSASDNGVEWAPKNSFETKRNLIK